MGVMGQARVITARAVISANSNGTENRATGCQRHRPGATHGSPWQSNGPRPVVNDESATRWSSVQVAQSRWSGRSSLQASQVIGHNIRARELWHEFRSWLQNPLSSWNASQPEGRDARNAAAGPTSPMANTSAESISSSCPTNPPDREMGKRVRRRAPGAGGIGGRLPPSLMSLRSPPFLMYGNAPQEKRRGHRGEWPGELKTPNYREKHKSTDLPWRHDPQPEMGPAA